MFNFSLQFPIWASNQVYFNLNSASLSRLVIVVDQGITSPIFIVTLLSKVVLFVVDASPRPFPFKVNPNQYSGNTYTLDDIEAEDLGTRAILLLMMYRRLFMNMKIGRSSIMMMRTPNTRP